MPQVPWWGALSSVAAPVLLVGGWTVAAQLQPAGFDPLVETISALAAYGATDRWVMTAALAGVGLCHVSTALALRPAGRPGRFVLAAGGVATVLVAATPLPADGGGSPAHTLWAAASFAALATWPAFAAGRGRDRPRLLRPVAALSASTVLLALDAWLVAQLAAGGQLLGLAERVAAGAQALWPAVVVLSARRRRR